MRALLRNNMNVNGAKFVSLFVATNLFSLIVATASILLVWHATNQPEQYHRDTEQECCGCAAPPDNGFTCPSEEGSIDFSSEGPVDLAISNGLCTLVQIAPDGKSFKPVGRSYEGYNWEASAGAFATLRFECSASSCIADLPTLPAGAVYQLTTFQAPGYSDPEIVARFLEQTTFGPTRSDIATFKDASDWSFATWIEQQQTPKTVPITSHRQFYRKRLNARQEVATQQGAVTHPCQAGARYRRFAFSSKDITKSVEIETSGSKRIVKVDGFVRTVVEGPLHWRWNASKTFEDGTYDIEWRRHLNKIGGAFYFRHEGQNKNLEVAFGGRNGNPPIQFDAGVTPNMRVIIPNESAQTVDTQYFQGEDEPVQEIILTQALSDTTCASLGVPGNPINPTFSFFDGAYWMHDPRFETINNSIESPAADGGGNAVRQTANVIRPEYAAVCANAPRTFLNEHSCFLSYNPAACSLGTRTYEWQDFDSDLPDFYLQLTPANLRSMYEVTGNGARNTRYVYAVEGLRASDDNTISLPCEKSTRSRWMRVTCSGAAASLNAEVHGIFQKLVSRKQEANPSLKDVWNSKECPAQFSGLTDFEIEDNDGNCWQHVHPDHWNVYDFTIWTESHPGNIPPRNPIKEFAHDRLTTLSFPDWHRMDRWQSNKYRFEQLGRLYDRVHYYQLPTELRSNELNKFFGFTPDDIEYETSDGVVVCGSPNEGSNDLFLGGSQQRGAFDSYHRDFRTTEGEDFTRQKRIVWTEVALTAEDQLRQRVAWALAQILVVSPDAISSGEDMTEEFLTYYDIFVRNAFGNYRDVLKEVAYSPIMGHMLTYYKSQSTAYIWQASGNVEFADENFAREIMQLFTTGLVKLNADGSQATDSKGEPRRVYTNDDILEYARVWTGFESQPWRGNIEILSSNRIDPMKISLRYRDPFPKMGMDRRYIGDGVPLCADLPEKHFLNRGATYRLLGHNASPDLQTKDPVEWETEPNVHYLTLQQGGALFGKLCGSQNPGSCQFSTTVFLDQPIDCTGEECNVDTLRTVEVANGIFYEYVRPPCVYQAFFNDAKTVVRRRSWWGLTCADPRTEIASAACCNSANRDWNDLYWGERLTFASAMERCADDDLCSRRARPSCDENDPSVGSYCLNDSQFWTMTACTVRMKIDRDGNVAIVHTGTDFRNEEMERLVQENTKTFFRVDWAGDFNPIIANCGSIGSCYTTVDDMCMCDVTVTDEQMYMNGATVTKDQVLGFLPIGAFDPNLGGDVAPTGSNDNVKWYSKNGVLTSESIFEVTDENGVLHHRKNTKSTVSIVRSSLTFRNPVHFISLSEAESRDAHHETDAALDQYFYHANVAPFLAVRFTQRFGISNPSPRYIETVAAAFRTGSYSFTSNGSSASFGKGEYGDLAATIASVLLDREARTVLLDTDPSHGSLREPLIKLIGLMRSLEFGLYDDVDFADFSFDLNVKIGQMAQEIPNVFSFFSPEYKPSGPVTQASLVAPEAQVMTGPRQINLLNGLTGLIKHGLSHCFAGFGMYKSYNRVDCETYSPGQFNIGSRGSLGFSPMDMESAEAITEELAMLLTGGRLSSKSRKVINQVINDELDPIMKVIKAQQLMVYTPEFHSTNIARKSGERRPQPQTKPPSSNPYKAIVYVLLEGGADTFNMLAPHTCSETNANGETLLDQYYTERTSLAITSAERSRIIDATDQPCSQFVIHQDLEVVERLYKEGDLAFFANAGVINKPINKDNYSDLTRTQLFAHNAMQEEAQRVDPLDNMPGTGVLGRMCDILSANGYNAQPVTVEDASIATVGVPGEGVDPLFVASSGTNEFDQKPDADTFDPKSFLDQLNDANTLQSSVFGETWSKRLQKALLDNGELLRALSSTQLTTDFASGIYSQKLKAVSTLVASHAQRGTDRDVFFVGLSGWDHHADMKSNLSSKFKDLDEALSSFVDEMKAQRAWDATTLVITSDFGRTLTSNSGEGSDHAWGGNYFITGGAVKGGRIHGQYPTDITGTSPLNVGRGRLIPTLSWESILNSCLQWMGVSDDDLDYCLPNRLETETTLFTAGEVFETN